MSPFPTQRPRQLGLASRSSSNCFLSVVTIRGGYTDWNFTAMGAAQSGMLGLNVISGMLSVENLAMQ